MYRVICGLCHFPVCVKNIHSCQLIYATTYTVYVHACTLGNDHSACSQIHCWCNSLSAHSVMYKVCVCGGALIYLTTFAYKFRLPYQTSMHVSEITYHGSGGTERVQELVLVTAAIRGCVDVEGIWVVEQVRCQYVPYV